MSARDFFLGKRIAVIGLGPHGEMVADAKYLIKANALVSIYDIRAEARVRNHIAYLRSIGLANHVCGTVPSDDLLDMDLIILSHEYPRDSSFLAEAERKGIQMEYPETLFLKLAPPVTVLAVMGSCGKATVLSMLAPMLETACAMNGIAELFHG
jgi:UDP-N-acetylmuramoylalanine-D-glutamate ligase